MQLEDHAYINSTSDKMIPPGYTYKPSNKEIVELVKLRISNNHLFSGKRHSSIRSWRAILKHMGLHHKMTHSQVSKKWENMKKRYKELKNLSGGAQMFPSTWPFFSLMDDALAGRLEGSAPILQAFSGAKDDPDFLPTFKSKKRKGSTVTPPAVVAVADGPEIEVLLSGDETREAEEEEEAEEGSEKIDCIVQEVENERCLTDSEQFLEREKEVIERERLVLQRERAVLDREIAVLDRDRALLERERAMMEREKTVMERERAMVEKDRDSVCRERLALEREKAKLEKLFTAKERTKEVTENGNMADVSDAMDKKERFLDLFEKLIEHF
ncbi:microtubule-associated protein 1A [Parambassis ranga]|uniref:Microtubule-associated protein 1A n=1 Tax=Parambassis ranga TaxID=210632 RepID=A0A6P7HT75_9TELE|nr:microtubule-associated protein 1A-like [Parambassis ranga]